MCLRVEINVLNAKIWFFRILENWILGETNNIFEYFFCDEKMCLRVGINVLNAKMIENWILGETNNILWTLLCVFAKFSISENWILKRTNNILSILLCSFRKVSESFKLIPRWNEQHFISTFVCCLLNLNLLKFDS